MILYHTGTREIKNPDIRTGTREIKNPDIRYGRKNADFGWGFYLTPDRGFACRWARENAVVNEYELEEAGLTIHRFSRDTTWFQYLFNNRRGVDSLSADVVTGPIANDTIFDTLGIMSSGFLKPEDALRLLMIGPDYTQVAIKTEQAVKHLRWIRSERIRRMEEEARKAEQDAYQEQLAIALTTILEGDGK